MGRRVRNVRDGAEGRSGVPPKGEPAATQVVHPAVTPRSRCARTVGPRRVGLSFVVQGLGIGLAVAVPVGPVNLLCIRRTLAQGVRAGLVTGLGAALADTVCIALVACGFSVAGLGGLPGGVWLRAGAGALLAGAGVRAMRRRPTSSGRAARVLAGGFLTSFALAGCNPLMLVSVGAIFAAAGLAASPLAPGEAARVVLGTALGSTLWWLTLTTGVGLVRGRCPERVVRGAEGVCGLLLVVAGALLAASP
jgi:threonine/homoserine/homoserine lactone efflux protein